MDDLGPSPLVTDKAVLPSGEMNLRPLAAVPTHNAPFVSTAREVMVARVISFGNSVNRRFCICNKCPALVPIHIPPCESFCSALMVASFTHESLVIQSAKWLSCQ